MIGAVDSFQQEVGEHIDITGAEIGSRPLSND
jgi:hypothetical protein